MENRNPCLPPDSVFTAAAGVSALLAAHLSQAQLNTVINLLTLITANLSAIVTQEEICAGNIVQPTI